MGKKVVPKLRQEVKEKVDIVTSDDIKIYYTGKFQNFTARYIIKSLTALCTDSALCTSSHENYFVDDRIFEFSKIERICRVRKENNVYEGT